MMTSAGIRKPGCKRFEVAGALALCLALAGCGRTGLGGPRNDGQSAVGVDSATSGGRSDGGGPDYAAESRRPALIASPPSVDFGTIGIGQVSTAVVVTVTNRGGPVALFPTVTGSGFVIDSTTCGAATASCTISLAFSPVSVGLASGVLTVAPGLTVSLSGIGIAPPSFSIVPSVLPATLIVNQSVPVSVTVTTSAALTGLSCLASGVDLTADPANTTCGAVVAANTPCVYAFTFKATTPGPKSDSIVCGASGVVRTVSVSPTAVAGEGGIIVGPAILGSVQVGSAGNPSIYSIANSGGTATGVLTVAVSDAQFAIGDDQCTGLSLPSARTCTFTVTFSPISVGVKSAVLSLLSGGTILATLMIQGTGVSSPPPVLAASPALVDFGTVAIGETSPASVVTVTNKGTPVAIFPTVTGSGFLLDSTTCGMAAAGCTVAVIFSPKSVGAASGVLTVAPGLTVSLSGVATPPPSFSIVSSVVPPTVLVNQSFPVSVTVTATGGMTDLSCLAAGADLTVDATSTTCTGILAANTPCVYAFTFKAKTPGDKVDSIVCSSGGVVKTVPVAPTAVAPASLVITPNPASFSAAVGTTSAPVHFTLVNAGGSASGNLNAALGGANAAEFAIVDNTCVGPLAPLSTCAIQVVYKPTSGGSKTATLTVTGDTAGSIPTTATLSAGEGPRSLLITGAANLGTVQVGQEGTPSTFTITNSGGSATPALTVVANDAEFVIGDDQCTGLPLPPSKTCTFTVTFSPTSLGVQAAVLSASSGGVTLAMLAVQGTGVSSSAPGLVVSPAAVNFGSVSIGETSPASVVTVTNKGAPAAIGPTVTGSGFLIDSTTCGSATTSCTISLKFAAVSVGPASGFLTVAPGLTVSLSGVGTPPPSFSVVASVVPATLLANQSLPISVTVTATGGTTDLSCLPVARGRELLLARRDCLPARGVRARHSVPGN